MRKTITTGSIILAGLALQPLQMAHAENHTEDTASLSAEGIAALARMDAAYGPSISPDGKHLAFISNASGVPQVWVRDLTTGEIAQVTRYEDPVGSVFWSPVDDLIAYTLSPGGGLNTQIYVAKPDGSDPRRLTLGENDNNGLSGWTPDGKYVTLNSNRDNPATRDAGLINVATGEWTPIVANKGLNFISDVRDGKALVLRLIGRGDSNVYLIDIESGAETLLTPHEGKAQTNAGFFLSDGKTAIVGSNVGRDREAIGRIDISTEKIGPIDYFSSRDDAVVEGAAVSDDATRGAIVWNVGGRSELQFHEFGKSYLRTVGSMGLDRISSVEFSPYGSTVYFTGSSANSPANIYALAFDASEPVQLTNSAHDGVDLERLVQPELIEYTSFDGTELSGWLYRPHGISEPMPLVFAYHGGPEGQARPSSSEYYQAIVASGIGVFAPNVRGSSGYGKAFMAMDDREKRFDGIRDIEATTNMMVERGIADPDRLAIMGGSYGGYMVMVGVTEYPDMFAAGINLFGMVNFESFFRETEPWMAAISNTEYGDPVTESDLLKRLSPIHKLDQIKTPLFVLHGANDTNVPVVEAEQIVENLGNRGVEVKYTLFPDEGHGWRKEKNRVRSTQETIAFLQEHLLAE